ncbi:bifunctional glycosyltransferase/CDP-glycerol:glycerophosphate glycerophosphotransferase [Actinoallomurus rhizosphaericola]|uniref:bifunctional glycosyltransferase/CDP-glycerol:glycerophosphate glycerophosphotransferase n=1 Tax=Actinoallomurus rhizosphaericola TaxID=2952536 RepID=UPI00209356B9|nr:bifunctional glycosyltransferase family 2 protein/CDP-glycerol:glycerophosphate glycerophosphotransferase [Actinoallomurus rhizosphaericola]MCO5999595.1 bifunctional glycosyltransferase family 2 protein/CDP-glycerol:glycerophosphate glycerophosphotransferase [Actinoallomurus rhizosphaericola]
MSPKLSVVVPFFNVEPYIEACLESIARQTMRDLEVIMVDDGSLDDSTVIAKAFTVRDPRFKLVQQENQGLGPARNTGTAHASGEYITFVDSDDIVARSAYELLVGSLDETGSDLAAGNVMRFNSGRVWQGWAHAEPFRKTKQRTHVTAQTNLMQDRMVWNKVFRRSFWDAKDLRFPGMLYEDSPVMVRAHVLASSVDVLHPHVYYWRQRDSGELSITQRKAELANLEDRMLSVQQVHDFLREHAPQLKAIYDGYALEVDLRVLVESLLTAPDGDQKRILELGQEFLRDVDPSILENLKVSHRLGYHLLGRGMLPQLIEVLKFDRSEKWRMEVVRRGRLRPRYYAKYPFFEDASLNLPTSLYDIGEELELQAGVDDVTCQDGRLRIDGHAYVKHLPMTSESRLDVWLEHTKSKRKIELPVTRVRRPDVTADSGQGAVSYADSGFRVDIPLTQLRIDSAWKAADWRIHVAVKTGGLRRTGTIGKQAPGRATWTPIAEVGDGARVQVTKSNSDAIVVRVKRPTVIVTGQRLDGDTAEITGWIDGTPGTCALQLTRRQGVRAIEFPVRTEPAAPAGGTSFTARIPMDQLAEDLDLVDRVVNVAQVGEGVQWDVSLMVDGKARKLAMNDDVAAVRHAFGSREVTVTRTRYGNLTAVERSSRPVVDRTEWLPDGRLRLSGTAAERPPVLILRHRRVSHEHRFPLSWDGDRFTVEFTPGRIAKLAGELPLASGNWAFVVNTPAGEVPVVIDRLRLADLTTPHVLGDHQFRLASYQTDALQLKVAAALTDDERGRYAQRIIQENDYPAFRTEPLRDLVVFDCYEGAQYSCSPRAVYEELERRGAPFEYVWVTKDGQFEVPGSARTVLVGSREHYRALAQARFVFGNYGQFPWFDKRDGQVYVQTWHGTPLKKLAYDLKEMPYQRTETLDWMEREVPRWDVLLSPNPFTTPIMRRAFGYQGEILESGYPRNDLLKSPRRDEVAESVRRRLNIPAGKTVVLYAPTWRDDYHIAAGKRGFSLQLDIERARAALSEDHVLLVRTHYLISDRTWSQMDDFVIDVSSYPDITDLYLVADVLITDYSSAMFDFAGTGKPILYFTYDLERYRDHVRGFYFDLAAEAPGPLLQTSDEVIEALFNLETVHRRYADAYDAWVQKFCPWDDGHAAARVIEHVIERS